MWLLPFLISDLLFLWLSLFYYLLSNISKISVFICEFYSLEKHMQNPRKEVNAVLKKEAAYFGDIVILPFMDRYELVVLKTIAICEYGVSLYFNLLLLLFPNLLLLVPQLTPLVIC